MLEVAMLIAGVEKHGITNLVYYKYQPIRQDVPAGAIVA